MFSGPQLRWKTVVALVFAMLAMGMHVSYPAHALAFSSPTSLPNPDPNDNVFPKLLQLLNGSVWMVWEKVIPAMSGDIYLMANNGYGWGGAIPIVTGTYDDVSPSIAQLDNGTIILVWSRGNTGNLNSYNIYTQSYTNGRWTTASPLVTSSPPNFDPVLTKASDGSVWMVWSRASSINGNGDLYYKVLRNGLWAADAVIPTASNPFFEEKLPGIVQAADGKIIVAYEANPTGLAQLYYTKYTGSSWTTALALTSTTSIDKWPSITIDRNGSLWIFWARELPNGTSPPPNPTPQYQWDTFYKTSPDNGTSWTTDTNLSNNLNTHEQHPTAFQGPDKELWIVYDSCCSSPGNPYGNPNLFITKSSIIPAHDLALGSLTLFPTPNPRLGENATFTMTAANPGSYPETSIVNFYVDSSLVEAKTLTINPGNSITLTFTWTSAFSQLGKHVTTATIGPVTHEFWTMDNTLNATFLLLFRGDVNRNGKVTIEDLSLVASHFGSRMGYANYAPEADLNHDGTINILDVIYCSSDFGKILP